AAARTWAGTASSIAAVSVQPVAIVRQPASSNDGRPPRRSARRRGIGGRLAGATSFSAWGKHCQPPPLAWGQRDGGTEEGRCPGPAGEDPRAAVVVSLSIGIVVLSRGARAVGDRDLDGFRPRLDPVAASDGLQPGMTLWLRG